MLNIPFSLFIFPFASIFDCSKYPKVLNIQDTCIQMGQILYTILSLFIAVFSIVIVLSSIGIEINFTMIWTNILLTLLGIGLAELFGQNGKLDVENYGLDIILLILSFFAGKYVWLVTLLIVFLNLSRIEALLN